MSADSLLQKVKWRLLPFLFLLYVVAYLDRINVGFAALQMQADLGFGDAVFGLGAGIFFLGYFLFQVPSNLALQKVGARRWIALLMIVWGVISASMLWVHSPESFYLLRFLLGAAEAGFFPGVIFYLRLWFPSSHRAHVVALFMTAGPVAGVIGSPISGALLSITRSHGLAGWQWMFLLEALPAIVFGVVTFIFLSDSPQTASWLSAEERATLQVALQEEPPGATHLRADFRSLFLNPMIWALCCIYFGLGSCTYSVSIWLPTVLKNVSGGSNFQVGLLSVFPYLAAAVLMVLVGNHSDRTGERPWHVAVSAFSGAVALSLLTLTNSAVFSIALLAIALSASSSMSGPFWAIATRVLTTSTAAAGIALINAIGNIGSGFGPYWLGYVKQVTGSFRVGLLTVGALMLVAGTLAARLKAPPQHVS